MHHQDRCRPNSFVFVEVDDPHIDVVVVTVIAGKVLVIRDLPVALLLDIRLTTRPARDLRHRCHRSSWLLLA